MGVFNLVKADIRRLVKDKSLKVVLLVNFLLILFVALTLYALYAMIVNGILAGEELGVALPELDDAIRRALKSAFGIMTYVSTFQKGSLGLFALLAVAMFVGKDFSYNTIRNKIISGNSRVKIYLSTLATSLIVFTVFYIFNMVSSFIIVSCFFGLVSTAGQLFKAILLTLPVYFGLISLICFISMTTKSLAGAIFANICVLIVPDIILGIIMPAAILSGGDAFLLIKLMSYRPSSLISELLVQGISNISEVDLSGLFELGSVSGMLLLRVFLIPLIMLAVTVPLGAYLFHRADIK